jgi:hypothetical protein
MSENPQEAYDFLMEYKNAGGQIGEPGPPAIPDGYYGKTKKKSWRDDPQVAKAIAIQEERTRVRWEAYVHMCEVFKEDHPNFSPSITSCYWI